MNPSKEPDNHELQRVSKLSDEELVKRVVSLKDASAYGILYDRYAEKIYNRSLRFIPIREEAQDLTHDLFIKLYYKLKLFQGQSSFSTWLYSFTYNFCLNYLNRKHKVKQEKEQEFTDQLHDAPEEIDDTELMELKAEKLKAALSQLEVNDRAILLMKYQDEFSVKEIGQTLEIGESAVKMRINRAKKRVLEEYKNLRQ